jgi:hypothetical protein
LKQLKFLDVSLNNIDEDCFYGLESTSLEHLNVSNSEFGGESEGLLLNLNQICLSEVSNTFNLNKFQKNFKGKVYHSQSIEDSVQLFDFYRGREKLIPDMFMSYFFEDFYYSFEKSLIFFYFNDKKLILLI